MEQNPGKTPLRGAEMLRVAIEAAPHGIVIVGSTGEIAFVNPQAARIFGYSREELAGESIDLLVPDRFRARHAAQRQSFLAQPEARAMSSGRDLHGRRQDGSEVPLEIGLHPIETADGLFVLASVLDITERKAAEEALDRRTLELERSNAELQRVAGLASHDLRAPLRMIGGFADVLREEHAGELSADARECLEHIRTGISRMERLVRDLVAYARLGTSADHRPAAADDALDAALANLHVVVRELQPRIERQPLPVVLGDDTELVQLFQNLLDNALRFHRLQPPTIWIDARPEGDRWLFSIRDDGIGISSEHHQRIFELFFRLHTSDSVAVGTGIGLAIAKRIVERTGGRIWVESETGQGTTFFFTLPAAAPSL